MPQSNSLAPAEQRSERPIPIKEQTRDLKQEAQEELFDLQSLIKQTRRQVPSDDIVTLDALQALDAEAKAAHYDYLASYGPSAETPQTTTAPTYDFFADLEAPAAERKRPMQKTLEAELPTASLDAQTFAESLAVDREGTRKLAEQAVDNMFKGSASLEDLEVMLGSGDNEVQAMVKEKLTKKLGAAYAVKVMNDPGYRESLKAVQMDVSKPLGEEGPLLLESSSLEKLVALQEMFGPHTREVVQSFNLGQYDKRLKPSASTEALKIQFAVGKEGQKHLSIGVNLNFSDEKNQNMGTVERGFEIVTEKTTEGEREKKSVRHYSFKLTSEYQGDGLATKMLAGSLESYDKFGVAEIKTKANIDLGGYVWQGYGFGWDMEEAASGLNVRENPKLAEQNLEVYIKRKINNAKENAVKRLETMWLIDENGRATYPELQALLDEYDLLAKRGLAVTPQDLAQIGQNEESCQFYRQVTGEGYIQEETWMTADEFAHRRRSGALSAEEATRIEKNAFHIGKLGMAHGAFEWDGKIDLEKGSPSRALFEDKLRRSTKR